MFRTKISKKENDPQFGKRCVCDQKEKEIQWTEIGCVNDSKGKDFPRTKLGRVNDSRGKDSIIKASMAPLISFKSSDFLPWEVIRWELFSNATSRVFWLPTISTTGESSQLCLSTISIECLTFVNLTSFLLKHKTMFNYTSFNPRLSDATTLAFFCFAPRIWP